MPSCFRPRLGRWSPSHHAVAVAGWAFLTAALAAGGLRMWPALSAGERGSGADAVPGLEAKAERAKTTMESAQRFLRESRRRAGVHPDAEAGHDASGLIGGELTPLVTTLGSLEAKRIAANPAWARELTVRLAGAGIGRGDLVAAGFSGSFPGLNLALMCACQSLGAEIIAVSSVTASTWGANQPGFTWPEMEAGLVEAGIVGPASVAVTAGGDSDLALDLEPEGRSAAYAIRDAVARRLRIPALQPQDFDDAVRQRLAVYRIAARGRPLALYANVGGADASLGRSAAVLRLRSGFVAAAAFGRPGEQGVAARLAGQGVRLLLLLNVRDLASRWGLPLSAGGPAE